METTMFPGRRNQIIERMRVKDRSVQLVTMPFTLKIPKTNSQRETQVQYNHVVQSSMTRSSQGHGLIITPLSKAIQGSGKMGSGTLNRETLSHGKYI
jgi:hypothetical protein